MYTPAIETFLTVIRCGSLSRAANALNVAQTTISHRLTVLEQELGFSLIERGKGIRQVRLTPSGEEFLKLAEQWSNIWRDIKILKSQGPMINLVVGSVDSFNTVVLPEVYRALNSHQPPIRLDIRTLHSIEIYSEVEKRQIDVGFAVRDIVYPNVNVKKCFSSPMVVLCAKSISSPFSTDMVHPSALDPNHELVMPWGRSFSNWHEHWWDPLSPSRIKLDNTHMLMNLLQDPKQWTIVPMFLANAVKAKGSYRVYRLAENPPNYTCYRITHKNPTSVNLMALSILDSYFGLRAAEEMSELDVAAETTS